MATLRSPGAVHATDYDAASMHLSEAPMSVNKVSGARPAGAHHRSVTGVRTTVNDPPDTVDGPRPMPPLARYRIRFREHIPPGGISIASPRAGYLGSAWRGAFGHALRKAVCVTRLPACDPCVLLRSCPYPFLFESRTPPGAKKLTRYPRTPGPFVLEPADPRFDTLDRDGTLSLGVTLFGAANDHLPYVVHALEQAGRQGLTGRRVALDMLDVQAESRRLGVGDAEDEAGSRSDARLMNPFI